MSRNTLTRRGFMVSLGAWAGGIATGLLSSPLLAARSGRLLGASVAGSAKQLTVALQLDEPVAYKVFTLNEPDRVVIDLQDTRLATQLNAISLSQDPVASVRYATRDNGSIRLVLELANAVTVKSAMKSKGSQNVLEIVLTSSGTPKRKSKPESQPEKSRSEPSSSEPAKNKFIVMIDPGHGGKDPGATGKNGTREKDVVLEVARKLKARLNRDKGVKAMLTRESDTFIPLLERINIAHRNKADLFVSIHADASPNAQLNGSTVYILSETGASSEAARLLAESENAYDVKFGGMRINGASNPLASVLIDLSQNAMAERSLSLAKGVLTELSKVNDPLRKRVESAGFVVLKSPDIPSMLVETAFISNPAEEKRLRTAEYQQKIANAMYKGIKRYQVAYADNNVRNA